MNYPLIKLKIQAHQPILELHTSENSSRVLLSSPESLSDFIIKVAEKIELNADMETILEHMRLGDELMLEFGDVDFQGVTELDFNSLLTDIGRFEAMQNALPEVNQEMKTYWQQDVLASIFEEIYNILIASTLHWSSEMGIDNIVLEDQRQEPRLREKMSKELSETNIELVVVETLPISD